MCGADGWAGGCCLGRESAALGQEGAVLGQEGAVLGPQGVALGQRVLLWARRCCSGPEGAVLGQKVLLWACWWHRLGLAVPGLPAHPGCSGRGSVPGPVAVCCHGHSFIGAAARLWPLCGGAVPILPILCRHGGGWHWLLPCCCLLGLDVTFGWCCQATRTAEFFLCSLFSWGTNCIS